MTNLYKLPTYEQHPIAIALMPGGMDDTEFDAFCADVEQKGIMTAATLYEGKVLDGWHRYRAAQKTGSKLDFITYEGKDPAGYIASMNVMRRKLSSLQRCLVASRLHRDYNITQREACKRLGVSNEIVNLVLRAIDSKNTKLIKRIESESDFTRGMLKEELEDSGLLRKKEAAPPPKGPNSVFELGSKPGKSMVSAAGAAMGLEGILDRDTDGSGDEGRMGEGGPEPQFGKGKKAADRAARKPKDSAAQALSEEYQALMEDEKVTFLRMIWPTAKKLVELNNINISFVKLPVKKAVAVKKGKKVAA